MLGILNACALLVVLAGAFAIQPANAFAQREAAEGARDTAAILQMPFWTTTLEANEEVFSSIAKQLTLNFGHLKLNTLGRGLHSTLLYLDHLTPSELEELASFFRSLSKQTLQEYDLLRSFKVLTKDDIRVEVFGKNSLFFALKPHPEMAAWQQRFWTMIRDRLPRFYERHLSHAGIGAEIVSAGSAHICLAQFGEAVGISLSPEEIEQTKEAIQKQVHSVFETTGKTEVRGGLSENGIEIAQPPLALSDRPLVNFGFWLSPSGNPSHSKVVRWREGTETIREWSADSLPQDVREKNSWVPTYREFSPMSEIAALQGVENPALVPLIRKFLLPIHSNILPTKESDQGRKAVFAAQTHPWLDPNKGLEVLPFFESLDFKSLRSESLFTSDGFYASGVRGDIANPSDFDLLESVLIRVPTSVTEEQSLQGYRRARDYAANIFVKTVFGRLRELIRTGRVSLIELRIGSEATMGNGHGLEFLQRFQEHPYLREVDLMRGYYIDGYGKKWSVEELVSLGDFIKSKLDLFINGKRVPVSLQFFVGFEWGGAESRRISTLHSDGLKGIPPLMRTAVYGDVDSYLTGLLMRRSDMLVRTQRGDVLQAAIFDLLSSLYKQGLDSGEHLTAKFAKRMLNALILMARGSQRLDLKFLKEAYSEMGIPFRGNETVSSLAEEIRTSINQPVLGVVGKLKQIVIDFKELGESKTPFSPPSLEYRLLELRASMEDLLGYLGRLDRSGLFAERLELYGELLESLPHQQWSEQNRIIQELISEHRLAEALLYEIEERAISDQRFSPSALPKNTQEILIYIARRLPGLYLEFQKQRRFVTPREERWAREMMGSVARSLLTPPQEAVSVGPLITGCRSLF